MKVDGIAAILPEGWFECARQLMHLKTVVGYVGQEFMVNAVWPLLIFGPVPFISYLASVVIRSDIWKRN